jgi:hypothetical protein
VVCGLRAFFFGRQNAGSVVYLNEETDMAVVTQIGQPQTELTFKDVWAMFQETAAQMKETDLKIQETAARIREVIESQKKTDEQMKEVTESQKKTDEQMKKTDEKIDKLSANLGGIGNSLGDMTEGLLTTDLLERFKALNLDFDDTLHNITIHERGTKREVAEIDWLLLNTTIALVGESKTHMTKGDVDKHIQRMKKLSGQPNNLIGGKKLYSAMAGVKINNKTREYARNKGLFVLEPSGNTVKIEAPAHAAVW